MSTSASATAGRFRPLTLSRVPAVAAAAAAATSVRHRASDAAAPSTKRQKQLDEQQRLKDSMRCSTCNNITRLCARRKDASRSIICFACITRIFASSGSYKATYTAVCDRAVAGARELVIQVQHHASGSHEWIDVREEILPLGPISLNLLDSLHLLDGTAVSSAEREHLRTISCHACEAALTAPVTLESIIQHFTKGQCNKLSLNCADCSASVSLKNMPRHMSLHEGRALLDQQLLARDNTAEANDDSKISQWFLSKLLSSCKGCKQQLADEAVLMVGHEVFHAACVRTCVVKASNLDDSLACTKCETKLNTDPLGIVRLAPFHSECAALAGGMQPSLFEGWSLLSQAEQTRLVKLWTLPSQKSIPVHPPSFSPSMMMHESDTPPLAQPRRQAFLSANASPSKQASQASLLDELI